MKAIPDSHNFRRHELVARELEREFGHAHVQGAHIGREGERPARTPSHAEMQQAERTGIDPKEAKTQLTAIWNRTDSGKAFAAAIEEQGWMLARGNRRDFVVLDQAGEVHSLARRIDGANAKDIRTRMADVDAASLPNIDQAKELQLARAQAQAERESEKQRDPAIATSSGGMVAQQMEALRRFERNSDELSRRREASPSLPREAEQPGSEKPSPAQEPKQAPDSDERLRRFKEQLDRSFSRDDKGDRSR
jgi:hypothetical protein